LKNGLSSQYDHVVEVENDGIYAVGYARENLIGSRRDGLITKLDFQGNVLWEKTFRDTAGKGMRFRKAIVSERDGILVRVDVADLSSSYGYLRVTANGDVLWFKSYLESYGGSLNLCSLPGNKYLIFKSFPGKHPLCIIDDAGNILATKMLDASQSMVIEYAIFDGTYIVLVGYGSRKLMMIRLDLDLNLVDHTALHSETNSTTMLFRGLQYVKGFYYVSGVVLLNQNKHFIGKIDASGPLPSSLSLVDVLLNTNNTILNLQLAVNDDFVYFRGDGNNQFYQCDLNLQPIAIHQIDDLGYISLNQTTPNGVLVHNITSGSIARLNLNLESCKTQTMVLGPFGSIDLTQDTNIQVFTSPLTLSATNYTVTVEDITSVVQPLCTFEGRTTGLDYSFHSYLHQIKWQSVEDYEFNRNIPGQNAIQEDYQASVDAVAKMVTPVWRPNAKYYLHFKLQDEVDSGSNTGTYDYYYGFQTAGPVGHFHNAAGVTYGGDRDGNGQLTNPDKYALANLRKYIDYQRSYPNADGNLLRAKPLFYSTEPGSNGSSHNEIALFFTKAYAIHLMNQWPAYQGLSALEGKLQIVVKDPIEDIAAENPPAPDVINTKIPQATIAWESDDAPPMPEYLKQLNNFVQEQENNPDLNCLLTGGEPIKPLHYLTKVTLNHLKPQKMYTAIVNNIFGNQTLEVHNFVFQTSRYAHFAEQVNSYLLQDEQGNQQPAVFTVELPLEAGAISSAYSIVRGNPDAASLALESQFNDWFARVTEGWWKMMPLAPALTTEFNWIKDTHSGQVVALLIRNPEPFNDPKIPLDEIEGTIAVMNGSQVDSSYQVLFSPDYSQAIVMPDSQVIGANPLTIRFQYKKWNGNTYQIFDTVTVNDLPVQL